MDANSILSLVSAALAGHVRPGRRLTVGLSGGVDSVVALHLLKALAATLAFDLAAHHVNHGLSPHAGAWMDFCADLCRSWDVPFSVTVLTVPRDGGKGIEAAARQERYRALAELDCDYVVLGQHQDDQAETLLLQLLRGAGVRGLSGMGVRSQESEVRSQKTGGGEKRIAPVFLRPLLEVARADIEAYARQRGLRWIDDESNTDSRYSRNYLRRQVLPLIENRFPAYRDTVSRAAAHCAEASELLDDLAAIDARQAIHDRRLAVDALAALPPARGRNLMRYFIRQHGLLMPDQDRLAEMLRQLAGARDDARVCLVHEGHELRRFRGQVYVLGMPAVLRGAATLIWQGEPVMELAALGGSLHFDAIRGSGIALDRLRDKPYTVRFRRGGERLRPRAGPSRSLRNLLQESALPPWERDSLPLLFDGDTLAAVPGIAVHAPYQCAPDDEGIALRWVRGLAGRT